MDSVWKLNVSLLIVIVLVGASFGTGWYVGKEQAVLVPIEGVINTSTGTVEGMDFSLFWDAWVRVQEKYVGAEDLDFESMVYGAISGMIDSLDDPYTVFLDPEDTKKFNEDVSGSFSGVGMEIGIRDDVLRVIAPLDGTPADNVGLRAGDDILKVDEIFTRGITIDEAVSLIRGEEGTDVTLLILRDGWNKGKDFVITRGIIEIPSLEWELVDENIAYIQLNQFFAKAGRDFNVAAQEILSGPADRIVLDLRNNPGGFLDVSVDIAGWFFERGSLVTTESFGGERDDILYKAKGSGMFSSYPIVVLINAGSASASEILAGSLRDNLGVILVGEQSFGKGSVQQLEDLRGGSTLKVTVANWLTPAGNHITDVGLTPDVEIDITNEDFEAELDPQFDKAIELIKNL